MMNYFKRILQKKTKGFVFTTRNLANQTANGDRIRDVGMSGGDFFTVGDSVVAWSGVSVTNSSSGTVAPVKPERIAIEPKAVFEEIKKETPALSFEDLPEKIRVVEERINVLKEHLQEEHLGDEHRTLFYLKNRLKYLTTRKKNPLDWAMTTRDAVEDLCTRYKLCTVPLKQYYTLVPKEGIKEIERYTKAYKAITGDVPIFELVVKETEVKTEEHKQQKKKDRDPILLANSPLANTLFVLGAWDDEVEIVDEIIYGMK